MSDGRKGSHLEDKWSAAVAVAVLRPVACLTRRQHLGKKFVNDIPSIL